MNKFNLSIIILSIFFFHIRCDSQVSEGSYSPAIGLKECKNNCQTAAGKDVYICIYNCNQKFLRRSPEVQLKYNSCLIYCEKLGDTSAGAATCRQSCAKQYPLELVRY